MSVRLTRLEQSGFLIEAGDERIACDLYLSDHLQRKYRGTHKPHDRLHPPTRTPQGLAGLRWVFASHRHSDHLDPGSIEQVLAASPAATLVLPAPLVGYARRELGIAARRMHGARPGERIGPFTLVPAAHPKVEDQFLSAVVDVAGLTIFHSGDTLTFPEQREILARTRPDVMLLPANGRVAAHLGTPPNMSLEEGLSLARACGEPLVIPHHYDLFAFNSRPSDSVAVALSASELPHCQLRPGESVVLTKADGGVAVAP